jgi:uncharacterized membrane protein
METPDSITEATPTEATPKEAASNTNPQVTATDESAAELADLAAKPPQGSYVKHAMRNMVRKRGTSLKHFAMTTVGLLAVMIGLAYLTR